MTDRPLTNTSVKSTTFPGGAHHGHPDLDLPVSDMDAPPPPSRPYHLIQRRHRERTDQLHLYLQCDASDAEVPAESGEDGSSVLPKIRCLTKVTSIALPSPPRPPERRVPVA